MLALSLAVSVTHGVSVGEVRAHEYGTVGWLSGTTADYSARTGFECELISGPLSAVGPALELVAP